MATSDREVIKEFLVSLGFQVQAQGLRNFTGGLTNVTNLAATASKAVVGVAIAAEAMVTGFAASMEKMYYASKRNHDSVENIQALEFASRTVGVSADTARAALESMSAAVRMNPGLNGLLGKLGVNTAQGGTQQMMDLVDKLSHMPHYVGARYAEMFGIDEKTFLMWKELLPEMKKAEAQRKAMNKDAGIDADAGAAASRDYMNSLRALWEKVEVLGQSLSITLLPLFKDFTAWVNTGLDALLKFRGTDLNLESEWGKQFNDIKTDLENLDKQFSIVSNTILGFKAIFWQLGEWASTALHIVADGLGMASAMAVGDRDKSKERLTHAARTAYGGREYADYWEEEDRKTKDKGNQTSSGKIGAGPTVRPPTHPSTETAAPTPVQPRPAPTGVQKPLETPEAAPTSGWAGTPSGQAPNTLGMRQNNPGNLRPGGGWSKNQPVKGFEVFDNAQQGLSAMAGQLLRYSKRGIDSVKDIVTTYAPPSDNNPTEAYIDNVSKKLGVGKEDKLNLQDPAVLEKLMGAMISQEQRGYNPFNTNEMRSAINDRYSRDSGSGGTTVTQDVKIYVQGGTDPGATAREVAGQQQRVNADLVRNLKPRLS